MAVIVSDSTNASYTGNLSTANGFYISRTYNLGTLANMSALSTPIDIPVTFTGAGVGETCKGIVLALANQVSGPYSNYPKDVTVTLQELVGGTTWTDRATSTHTTAEINPGTTTTVLGYWLVPFKFAIPYAIDTTANIWRFHITQSATAGNSWSLCYTTAGNYTYVAWGNATTTASSGNDTLVVVDKVLVDTTFTLKPILGTGMTTYGVCGWICRNTDITQAGNALLEWQNPATASYTLTIDGHLTISNHGGIRVGTVTSPIAYANQAKIVLKSLPSVGSSVPSSIKGPTQYYHDGYQSLFFYGEVPTYMSDTLALDANAGQKIVTTTHSTGWKSGDTVYIGREDIDSYGDQTESVLDVDASGTTITLLANIAGAKRLAGGHIINITPYGVWITSDGNSICSFNFHVLNNMTFSGCRLTKVQIKAGINNAYCRFDTAANTSQWLFQNSSIDGKGYSSYILGDGYYLPTEKGVLWDGCVFHRCTPSFVYNKLNSSFNGGVFNTGSINLKNSIVMHCNTPGVFTTPVSFPALVVNIENNFFENNISGVGFAGVGGTFKNNNIYSTIGTSFGIYLFTGLYPVEFSGNTINRTGTALLVPTGTVLIGYKLENLTLNNLFANDVDFGCSTETFIDLELSSPTGLANISTTTSLMLVGSKLRIPNATATNDDRVYTPYGNFQRTGTGLTDTTVRTAGGFGLRFASNSSTNLLEWEFSIPTGNIQNKTMMVGIWCKINNAAYWAGTNQLPRLTIDYDNGTTAYVQASNTTEWQFLPLPFTPLTTYGQITVTVSTMTDATTSDAYVYFDDFKTLFPAEAPLDTQTMDLWANGLPVTPPIATVLSANDVWSAATSTMTGTGTIGEKVSGLKTPKLLIGGQLILSK